MTTTKRVPQVLIGDGVNSSATALPSITKGDLFLVKDGAIITTTSAAAALKKSDKVQIAMGIGTGKALLSSLIEGNLVTAYKGNKYDAPVQKIQYVGYNGTSGSLPTTVSTEYRMRVAFKGANVLTTRGPWFEDAIVKTGATTTQSALAYKLVDAMNYNYDASKYLKIERIHNGTKAVVGTATTSFTFTKGSKAVTCAGDIDDATGDGAVALAVGGSIVIGATGNTDAIYIITAIDTTNNVLTLDVPFAGETVTLEDTALKNTTAAATAAATFGIKITGKEIEPLLNDYDQYKITNFETSFCQIGYEGTQDTVAAVVTSVSASPGNGYNRQVRELERESQSFRGWHDKTEYYHSKPDSMVGSGINYDSISIEFSTPMTTDFGATSYQPAIANIFIPTGLAQSDEDTSNSFASIINGYFSTVCGFTAVNLDA